MYREARTLARPPQTVRLPLIVPLSRLKGSHSDQRGDLPVAQSAQLGQVSQQSEGDLLSDTGNRTQEVILLPPYGTVPNGLS